MSTEPGKEAHVVDVRIGGAPRATSAPRAPKRTVNIRPAAALAGNAAVAGAATLYAAAGVAGLAAAGVAIVGGTAATVAKSRARAAKEAKITAAKVSTPAARRAAASKSAAAGARTGGKSSGLKRAMSAVGNAAKKTGAALSAPKRAAAAGRNAAAKGATPRQAAAAAKRRAQVGAALKGKKSRRARGAGAALLGGASAARQAWKKSGEEARKKKAAEAKKKAQAKKGAVKAAHKKKVSKELRKNPNAPITAPAPVASALPVTPVSLPAIPLPGAVASAPLATGGNMSYSPMRAMLELAEEMTRAAGKWNPAADKAGMLDVLREFSLWPEVIKEVANAAKIISDMASDPKDGLPLNPVILSVIESVHRNQTTSVVSATEEIPGLIRSLHRKQIEVLEETPHHVNNDMWGYSANREAV